MLLSDRQRYETYRSWVAAFGEARFTPAELADWRALQAKYEPAVVEFDAETWARLLFYRRLFAEGRLTDA